jgi:hypothetical protein
MRMKRLIDIILSFIALIILSPLFAIVAILIKLDSKGPVFYRGVRIGRYGKPEHSGFSISSWPLYKGLELIKCTKLLDLFVIE